VQKYDDIERSYSMFRPLASLAVAVVALASLAGCASGSHQAVSHSLAKQVPGPMFAEEPPSDCDFELKAPERSGRITRDTELTGSLRADSPTKSSDE
jgi:hypothetical protein